MKEYEKACLAGVYKNQSHTELPWRMKVLSDMIFEDVYFDVFCRTRYQPGNQFTVPQQFHPGCQCLPGNRRLFIAVDGNILPCERVPTHHPYFVMGNIRNHGLQLGKAKQIMNDFTNPSKEECKSC